MNCIAAHQPNFLPWPGFFAKMAQADHFVLLDDAQFSKNNIINRVRIMGAPATRWLTIPVKAHLGCTIAEVSVADPDWRRKTLSLLRNTYGRAGSFREIWPRVEEWFVAAPDDNLAAINIHFIRSLAGCLGIRTPLYRSSELGVPGRSDDRLVEIACRLAPGGAYLSGKGGAAYQDPAKFEAAGLRLDYYRFTPSEYDQGLRPFQAGLSVIDVLFHAGTAVTAAMVRGD